MLDPCPLLLFLISALKNSKVIIPKFSALLPRKQELIKKDEPVNKKGEAFTWVLDKVRELKPREGAQNPRADSQNQK